MTSPEAAGPADIPSGLIDAVASLVATGPVPLGGYTLAEVDAVSGMVQFLESQPAPEAVAEAVRSLAARNLITTRAGSDEVQVRGDLGIALAFAHRSRVVIDARVTGTEPDRPWRFVLMPQPEDVTLEILIDALGIHFYSLRTTEDALERLWERLPSGDRGPEDAGAEAVLGTDGRRALVSVSRWGEDGDRERMARSGFESRGQRQHLVFRPADTDHVRHHRLAFGERAGLVEGEGFDLAQRFQVCATLDEHTVARIREGAVERRLVLLVIGADVMLERHHDAAVFADDVLADEGALL